MKIKDASRALTLLIKSYRLLKAAYPLVNKDNGDEAMLCAVKSCGTSIHIALKQLTAIVPNGELKFTAHERNILFGYPLPVVPDSIGLISAVDLKSRADFKSRAAHDQ